MKGIWKTGLGLVCVGVLAVGCWAKPAFVQDEIKKAKDEINTQHAKQLDEGLNKVTTDMNKRFATIETSYALSTKVEADLYAFGQKMMKEVEARLESIKAIAKELQDRLDTFKLANEGDLKKLSQDLKTAANILLKQLKEQKEGIDRAMEELEKGEWVKDNEEPPVPEPPK
ncbi:MAG: hypothetical protein HY762_05280 [Planctomycetes bacterium]|nr:hypothetical protein [Planctomycetota bacterium]